MTRKDRHEGPEELVGIVRSSALRITLHKSFKTRHCAGLGWRTLPSY